MIASTLVSFAACGTMLNDGDGHADVSHAPFTGTPSVPVCTCVWVSFNMGIWAESDPKYAQNRHKKQQRARQWSGVKKKVMGRQPHIITHAHWLQNRILFMIRKKCDHLKYPQGTFFCWKNQSKNLGYIILGFQIFFFRQSLLLWWYFKDLRPRN